MDLSIIFVNWNAVDYLMDAIGSVYENTVALDFEIIVVDNASPKRDVDTLKIKFPAVAIIKSDSNLGFARANNLGFRQSTGRWVLFLNPDTKLVGPAVNTMMKSLETLAEVGIVGCRQVDPDQTTVQTTSIQKFPTILNQLLNIEFLRLRWPGCWLWDLKPLFSNERDPVEVEVIPGACMLLKREVFEQAGLFSEEYFMYGEDVDLNYKVAKLGLKNYYIPDAIIVHYGGASSKQQKVNQWATTMKYRAMDQYYTKSRGHWYAVMYRAAMGSSALVRLFLIALALPTGKLFRKGQGLRTTAAKWQAILRWAFHPDRQLLSAGDR